MINLIPMAGRGNRFVQKNYLEPKPFIEVVNEPMVIAALRSFPLADQYIFVCLQEHYTALKTITKFIKLRRDVINIDIITVDQVTQGQASTCLLAEHLIDSTHPLFIASCDYQMVFDQEQYNKLMNDDSIDVIVWTFKTGAIKKANPEAFAYCRIDNGQITEIVEKQTISNDPSKDSAVVGSFTYKKALLFFQGAKKMIAKDIKVNGEFYVGTSINQLIQEGFKVVPFEVEQFISFGNPFELELFNYWHKYFSELNKA